VPTASRTIDPAVLANHRTFPGNRPSTTLLLDELSPRSLGALIALYEHRVFTERRGLAHQQLRPVGCRARQGAERSTVAAARAGR
jgi:hypothetical protein